LKVAFFQFATNAVGKVPAIFENMLALYVLNGLEKAAGVEVVDMTPPPREGEILSLTGALEEEEVREAAGRLGADYSIWGSLEFEPRGEALIKGVEVNVFAAPREEGVPSSSRRFSFHALRGDVKAGTIEVEVPALEDLVEEMLIELAEVIGLDKGEMDLARIGEGLTYSHRALTFFIFALRFTAETQAKLRLYQKAISCDPYFGLAYTNAAQLLIGEGKNEEAMRLLMRAEKSLRGSDLEPNVLNLLGVAAMQIGMWDEAVKMWTRSLKIQPDYVEVLCNLASAYAMRDMVGEAEDLYRQAISCREDYPLAWFALGRLMAVEGRFEDAEASMRRYTELCPGDPWAYYILGTSLANLGREGEAEFTLAKASQLDPDGEAGALARKELQNLKT
jgi:tetratricopeptide (TPR) repeat protein